MREFKRVGASSANKIFSELCFCILTANFNAERAIEIQKMVGAGFRTLSQEELAKKLKELGYRHPNIRSKYIVRAREHSKTIKHTVKGYKDDKRLREWIVKNIMGLGYKEASHFLRNIGRENVAIIDFHIIDLMEKSGLIERPKTLTPKKYLEAERVLSRLAGKVGLSLAELDLYLWYLETGKVLK